MYGWGDILVKRNIISQAFWLENRKKIEDWVSEYFEKYNKSSHSCRPLIYSSIDMRNSGFKLAHVDANAFPAGFNNIHPNRLVSVKENFTKYLKKHANDPKKILLISEEFTRNISYLKT